MVDLPFLLIYYTVLTRNLCIILINFPGIIGILMNATPFNRHLGCLLLLPEDRISLLRVRRRHEVHMCSTRALNVRWSMLIKPLLTVTGSV